MGQSADELRRDIEQTRGGLTETLDAIGDRVSPGRVIERRKNRAVRSIQSIRDTVMGSATGAKVSISDGTGSAVDTVKDAPETVRRQTQGSPVAAGAIAFGVGFLVAAIIPPSQPERDAAQGLMDKAEPLQDELTAAGREVADHLKDAAKEAVEEVKTTAAESKQAVAHTARDGVDSTTSTTRDATATIKEQAS